MVSSVIKSRKNWVKKWVTNSLLFSFTQLFMLITLASNWNLTGGFTGYVDFGHAVFFGLGAYGTGIMMAKAGLPFVPALIIGAIVAAVFALIIGSATLRLKGPYFSIAMLGTFVAMREIVRAVPVPEHAETYAIQLVMGTQPGSDFAPGIVGENVPESP